MLIDVHEEELMLPTSLATACSERSDAGALISSLICPLDDTRTWLLLGVSTTKGLPFD
jgi:hypothetical protein